MARTLKSDKVLFWEAVVLVCASLVMIFSASAIISENKDGRAYEVFLRQLPWALMGLVALFVMMRVDYHVLRRPELAAIRTREGRRHHLHRRGARAADAQDQRDQVRAAARGHCCRRPRPD